MRGVSVNDRLVSGATYFTCGIAGIIWFLYAFVTKIQTTPFLLFNIYQSIFVSVILWIISYLYSIAVNILVVIPFVGKLVKGFDIFFNSTPIHFGFTISGLIVTVLLLYLTILSLLGRRPFLPVISDVVNSNMGG